MNDILIKNTVTFFKEKFGANPQKIILSPGRINIIGEHLDYNDGYVLPAAIDKVVCLAFKKNNSTTSRIIAIDFLEEFEINLTDPIDLSDVIWTNYLRGILVQLQKKGFKLEGFNCVFSSTIPVGSGLSSSAALECGFLFGVKELCQFKIKPIDIALMAQTAEHWVGVHCGIMDQFCSVMGLKNKVIKLDCRTLEYQYYEANFGNYSLILFDSNIKHTLNISSYNKRRQECQEGIVILKSNFPTINSFRDCNQQQVESLRDKMSLSVFKRSLFVVKENHRVGLACLALNRADAPNLGKLMFETHEGLSTEYEVSCPEVDFIVTTLKNETAVVGSRLMGAGFGGCTLNLIKKGEQERIKTKLSKLYFDTFKIELKMYEIKIGNGTCVYKKE